MVILGCDENNYSPSLAGDCIVTSLFAIKQVEGVRDSKQISHKQRLALFYELQKHSIYKVSIANVNTIGNIGIYEARNLAVLDSLVALQTILFAMDIPDPDRIILDGCWTREWLDRIRGICQIPTEGVIGADAKFYEVSAASIIGRIYADSLFAGWDSFYPGFHLNSNHGSPDKKMYQRLHDVGIPPPIFRTRNYGRQWWQRIMRGEW